MLGSIGPVVGSISAVPGSLRVILGSIGAGLSSIGAVYWIKLEPFWQYRSCIVQHLVLYRAVLELGAVGGGERSFSMACRCRVVVALRRGRMYVFQVGSIVLYVLEGSGLERAGNSGWVVTVRIFGGFIL